MAEIYLNKDNREEALKVIKCIFLDSKTKDAFYAKVGEAYLKDGDRVKALEVISSISWDDKTKTDLLDKLVRDCLNKKDLDNAFQTLKKMVNMCIWGDILKIDSHLSKLMILYHENHNKKYVNETVQELISLLLFNNLSQEYKIQYNKVDVIKIIEDCLVKIQKNYHAFDNYYKNLTNQFYPKIEQMLKNKEEDKILRAANEFVADKNIQQNFKAMLAPKQ